MASVSLQKVSKSYDGRSMAVDALDLHCAQGQMLALLGPSGCGKSSTLKMIAGIEAVSGGTIRFDGVDVTGLDSAGRNVAMVFEDYSLYPHLSAFENIAFPLRVRGVARAEVRRKVGEVVEMLGLASLLDEPVRALSGGAQQRVSIGRALVRDPALVMFDEPLSHLDADQKVVLRTEIRRLQSTAGLTSVLVTHDQTEAMAMADQIAVMAGGVLQQVGSPREVYQRPANRFVAGFIGDSPMNFFDATLAQGMLCLAGEGAPSLRIDGLHAVVGGELVLGVRPEDVEVGAVGQLSPGLVLSAEVVDRACCGDHDLLCLRAGELAFHAEVAAPSALRVGALVTCCLPVLRWHAFDPRSGQSLQMPGSPC